MAEINENLFQACRVLQDYVADNPDDLETLRDFLKGMNEVSQYRRHQVRFSIVDHPETITPGCWINTRYGQAVATHVTSKYIRYRYHAVRLSHNGEVEEEFWVDNGDDVKYVTFLSTPTQVSLGVLNS